MGTYRPAFLELRSSQWFIVTAVSLSMYTDTFLYAMIIPVMPTALVERAGVVFEDREYWISLMLAFEAAAALLCAPVFGYLLDRSGTRQRLYLLGLVLLLVAMIILTVSLSLGLYITARIFQGAATAMVSVAGFTIVTENVSKDKLGHMMGYVEIGVMLGFTSGPLLGGLVYHSAGYYAVFGMGLALVGVDLLLRLALIEGTKAKDYLAAEVMDPVESEVTTQRLYGTIENNEMEALPQSSFAIFQLLRHPRMIIAVWALTWQSILNVAMDTTLPIFVQNTFQWDSWGTGMIFLPLTITVLIQPLAGTLADRHGTRIVAFMGNIFLAPCLIALRLVEFNTLHQKIILCALLAGFGICNNSTSPSLLAEVQHVLDDLEEKNSNLFHSNGAIAQASSLHQMANFGGMALGPIMAATIDGHLGWKMMTLCLGTVTALTAVSNLWLSGSRRRTTA